MEYYTAYGLVVESPVALPELSTVDEDDVVPDVRLERGTVESVDDAADDGPPGRRVDVQPNSCRASYDDLGTFRVADGERIVFDPATPGAMETRPFRRILEGQMFGVLLHQRGLLVLHASAVAFDDGAALFLGNKGAGKSTTAAACYAQGYPLLDDDVVAIRFTDDGPTIVPGVPEVKLRYDAADALGVEGGTDVTTDEGARKRLLRVDERPDPTPLERCYLLQEGERTEIDDVPPQQRLFTLVSNTYTVGLLDETDAVPAHFEQCADVVDAAPVRALRRPVDLDALPDLVEFVADDLRTAEPDPA